MKKVMNLMLCQTFGLNVYQSVVTYRMNHNSTNKISSKSLNFNFTHCLNEFVATVTLYADAGNI